MKKIPTLFKRDPDNLARVLPEVHPACQWVLDGMCCAILGGVFMKRREVKKGKPDPKGFMLSEDDETTGKRVGWVPVGDGPEDKYFQEGLSNAAINWTIMGPATCELVGLKSQGGIERYREHILVPHCSITLVIDADSVPRSFDALHDWLANKPIEGVVWHHRDGRMAKIKGRDFGHRRPTP